MTDLETRVAELERRVQELEQVAHQPVDLTQIIRKMIDEALARQPR